MLWFIVQNKKRFPKAKAVQRKSGIKKNRINNAMLFMHIKTYVYGIEFYKNTQT